MCALLPKFWVYAFVCIYCDCDSDTNSSYNNQQQTQTDYHCSTAYMYAAGSIHTVWTRLGYCHSDLLAIFGYNILFAFSVSFHLAHSLDLLLKLLCLFIFVYYFRQSFFSVCVGAFESVRVKVKFEARRSVFCWCCCCVYLYFICKQTKEKLFT